jgi:hypothetical protein
MSKLRVFLSIILVMVVYTSYVFISTVPISSQQGSVEIKKFSNTDKSFNQDMLNQSRPNAPGGRPILQRPFEPVENSLPYLTCGYGCGGHSDAYGNQYYAVDFGLNGNSFPVTAAHSGMLCRYDVGGIDGNGNPLGTAIMAVIEYGNGWRTKYAHLHDVTVRGQQIANEACVDVQQGELIGNSGMTGANAIHLHFVLFASIDTTEWSYPVDDLFDTIPPDGGYTEPANGATIGNTITLRGVASDNVGVNYVNFTANYNGDWYLLFTDHEAPYEYIWDLSAISDQTILLGFDIYDLAGNIAQAPQGVRTIVKNTTPTPTRTATATPTRTATPTPTRTATATPTRTATELSTATSTPTYTPTSEATALPSTTPTHTPIPTPRPLSWQRLATIDAPPSRFIHGMAFDSERGVTVLFGGDNEESGWLNDTWEFDGTNWLQRQPAQSPPGRGNIDQTLIYDAKRQKVVLYGGLGAAGYLADTWEYDGTTWQQITTSIAPPSRDAHAMVFDSQRNKVLLFGGAGGFDGRYSDTWYYDGTWQEVSVSEHPSARHHHSLAFDERRGVVVLFGGRDINDNWVNDTWEFDGTRWKHITNVAGPSPRENHTMAYDENRGVIVLFGGFNESGTLADTWEYDGLKWRVSNSHLAPLRRNETSLVYDSRNQWVMLFGGSFVPNFTGVDNETWVYPGTAPVPAMPNRVYIPQLRR